PAIGPEAGGSVEKRSGHGAKSGHQWLHGIGQAVEHRAEDQTTEAESQGVAGKPKPKSAGRLFRGKESQKVKPQNGGWKNDGQAYDGFNEDYRARTAGANPPRQRDGEEQKKDRD